MMQKKLVLFLLLLVVGCSNDKVELNQQLINNGYELVEEGNLIKQADNNTSYLIYFLSNHKFFRISENDLYYFYFFENDWASVLNCSYDFSNQKVIEGTICSDEEIEKLKEVKEKFNKELEDNNITVDVLINEMNKY